VDQKNDFVEVNVEHLPHCEVRLMVKPLLKLQQEAQKQGMKSLKKEVELPGFRKGKAPDDLILKKYPAALQEEADKKIANLAFFEAEKLVNIPPLNNDSKISYDRTKEGNLVFTFETDPVVPNVDIKSFVFTPPVKKEISEEEMEEMIRQIRFFHATWIEVKDRPIKLNDYIIVDLEDLSKEPAELVFAGTRLEVTQKHMAKWMLDLVLGKNLNDKIEGNSFPDDSLSEEEKKEFSNKKVRVTIKQIEEARLPDMTDEFAIKVGAPNVEELKKIVRAMLEEKLRDKELDDNRKQVNLFLLQNFATFDLPKSLIKSEYQHRMDDILNHPASKKNWEAISAEEKKKEEENLVKEACNALFLFYLSRKVAEEAKISVSTKEVQNEAFGILKSSGINKPDKSQISDSLMALSYSRVLLAKVQDYILAQVEKN